MSDCCNTSGGFPSATQMAQLALNHPIVWKEICAIQQAILGAASQCQPGGGRMCTTVAGNTPMTFVSGVQEVSVVHGGSGYVVDTPSIKFIPPYGATVVEASATVVTNGGAIMAINLVDAGSGYQPVESTVSISSSAGIGANILPVVDSLGRIVSVNVIDGGLDYTVNDLVYATRAVEPNSAYVDAVFKITSVSPIGRIGGISVINPGSGYQTSYTTVQIVSSLDTSKEYPTGSGFSATVYTDATGKILSVPIISNGAGYSENRPYLSISDPGTGATALVNLTGSGVSSVSILNPGINYTEYATGEILNPVNAPLPNPPTDKAVVSIVTSQNIFGTDPTLYHAVWSGTATDRQVQMQLAAVRSHFEKLGYSVVIQTNPSTGRTIQWKICW